MDYPGNISSRSGSSASPSISNLGSSSASSGIGFPGPSPGGLNSSMFSINLNGGGGGPSNMMSGRCMCCNSNLRFPRSVTCFRCTVCETINDLIITPHNEQINPLTLDRIRALISYYGGPNYKLLEQEIQKAFTNWPTLNESFSNGRSVTLEDCGVALDQVREAYQILMELPVNIRANIIRAMMRSVESILKRPGRMLKRKEDIKFLMIILENPLLSQHNFPQESQYHHQIVQRVFGLLSNLSNELHHYLVNWFARHSTEIFRKRIELVNLFITFRLSKHPIANGPGGPLVYESDWQINSAAKVMALFFAANKQKKKIQLSEFYNTRVDYISLIDDFNTWELRSGKFTFCQYPFLVSMGGKTSIMEFDAKRQMESKAKEAIFSFLFQKRAATPHLILKVRRDYLIEDSLSQISENEMELKKSLRIEFVGEVGVDGGGLRKEWFLLLVRHLFDPKFGMFTWDEDSRLCWFNPASFEPSDQFYLVGVVIGLAIYNSTILDVHFPLACYKKLLNVPVGLEDLKEFRPAFARGLEQLLSFEGDVESTFCRDFVGEYEVFDEITRIPLKPNGQNIPVTNDNRKEYVERYVNFILNESVTKQFEPFRRGFNHVCSGNALSLFQPEEIELLVRGSAEPLEIEQLRSVTIYEGFREDEVTIINFWAIFKAMNPIMQRKLLTFVTGTDRIPGTGCANLSFKISYYGEDCERFPIAHTCFNQIFLYRYRTKRKLEEKLLRAITESEGFWIK
ncbi:HECT-domain-containing protein [Gigaspora margarita]|uniref:HECT-type E3 ubiquitin transferase n=1 Tax=Gigaspora margarita TaxID=4874 RepID=A0A8H3X2I1_GIGMA|nr:HECT-domain-containing protein [Gigaspora margarita]